MGRILIPTIAIDWVMVESVSLDDLAHGPGHMPGTAMPGQPGNAVVSGHRTTHGAPFFKLDLLEPDDDITIETLIGTHRYEVAEVSLVPPTAMWVTNQVDGAWLTLNWASRIMQFEGAVIQRAQPPSSGEAPPALTPRSPQRCTPREDGVSTASADTPGAALVRLLVSD